MEAENHKMIIENCADCGDRPYICSRGGVNCPTCFKFIRMLNPEEMKEHKQNMDKLFKTNS